MLMYPQFGAGGKKMPSLSQFTWDRIRWFGQQNLLKIGCHQNIERLNNRENLFQTPSTYGEFNKKPMSN